MMKTKYLLAALALPMAFAACSDDFDEVNSSAVSGVKSGDIKVTLNLSRDSELTSRATWTDGQLGWQESDKISMYWAGTSTITTATALTGASNAIFKTTDGSEFTSESLVYLGKNAVVYPANETHYSSKAIEIAVDTVQTASTVTKTPHISNLLNIQAEEIEANTPGYHQNIYAPMKLAANVVTLKLKLENTEALEKYNFAVESVQLVADKAFAKTSNLIIPSANDTLETKGWYVKECGESCAQTGAPHKADSIQTIVNSLWTKPATYSNTLTSSALVKNADGSYDVTFVVLPTDVATLADAEIIVKTSCGKITLKSSEVVKNTTKPLHKIVKAAEEPTSEDSVTIAEGLKFFASSIKMPKTDLSSFDGEFVGRTIARSIIVDASKAELTGSEVKTSADIIRYVNLYKDMKKTDAMNLKMVVDGATVAAKKAWANLTKEAVAAIDAVNAVKETKDKISLTSENVSEIQLSTVGSVYDVKAYSGSELPLVLTTGAWAMNDTLEVNAKFSKLVNKGTLTIAGTSKTVGTTTTKSQVKETIENQGTIALGGDKKVWMNGAFVNASAGIVNVAAEQELTFVEDVAANKLCGTINVASNAMLTVANGVKVYNTGVINNSGIIAAEGTEGLYNAACTAHTANNNKHDNGIINILTADAITYVQNNASTIKMFNRSNEVVVENNSGKIIYNYDYATDGAEFEVKKTDRFSYVVFGTDATAIELKDKNGTAPINYSGISLEFKGSTTFTTKAKSIDNLVVASGANLKVNSGNTLNVNNIYNNGTITIGGTINYTGVWNDKVGRVLSVGTGAIVAKGDEVAAAVTAKLNDAQVTEVALPSDVKTSSTLNVNGKTLDGQGYTLTSDAEAILKVTTTGGTIKNLVIDGNKDRASNGKATRGIFNNQVADYANSDIILENVEFKGLGYAFNLYGNTTNNPNLTVNSCKIEGWASTNGGFANVAFNNCSFIMGTYWTITDPLTQFYNGCINLQCNTEFVNCDFESGYKIGWGLSDSNTPQNVVIKLKNCRINGVEITDANKQLLAGDALVQLTIE